MPRTALTGSRIRDRRLDRKMRQADLARQAGISASYLNLIEHNRRRIGGKLLNDIARALDVEPAALSEGAAVDLIATLRDTAEASRASEPEVDRVEEFAGRFPGWARLIDTQARRIEALERSVEALSDRLTHDPFLQTSLHEVLSKVTAIRSTAAILTEAAGIDPEWQARFHRNLHEDSRSLAESSRALVAYLDTTADVDRTRLAPHEEVEAWLDDLGWRLPDGASADDMLSENAFGSRAGRLLAQHWLGRFATDAAAMPHELYAEARAASPDPAALARRFGVDVAAVLRRWALVPDETSSGLVICDGSGTMTLRKAIDGFPMPRFGAACPLWPLYRALAGPGVPIRSVVEHPGRRPQRFLTFASAAASRPAGFDGPVVHEATLLILPDPPPDAPAEPIGTSCRICPREACVARREPSILLDVL
ncbi:helix-turn-helix transcriptional regulator [Roseitranquillus sediminis]|uniref:helix-turn-helix transcriptional regulator n=1 Tax=Roseitranquillus sediminis TaxID=2809051 RepID=UPI001D0CA422|nr:helix-turn-helix transcriptional regulator [Roseitranquillus sediminis]MBM9595687.1 DUF2083 domain-containing protein [Roseitranquillus sediminis]